MNLNRGIRKKMSDYIVLLKLAINIWKKILMFHE